MAVPFEYDRQLVISVNVSDFARSYAWYQEVLGFEPSYELEEYGWGEVKTPWEGVYVGIGQTEELKQGGTVPTFGVKDIAAARSYLESHDVRFDGETYEVGDMVKLCTFYDPDGNAWMLAESRDRDARESAGAA
jgi:CreA protein